MSKQDKPKSPGFYTPMGIAPGEYPTPQPDIDELREKIQYIMGQVANWGQTFTDDGEDPSTRVCAGGTKALYPAVDEIISLLTARTEKAVSAAEIKLLEHLVRPEMYKLSQEKFNEKIAGRVHIELRVRRETQAELQATISEGGEDE